MFPVVTAASIRSPGQSKNRATSATPYCIPASQSLAWLVDVSGLYSQSSPVTNGSPEWTEARNRSFIATASSCVSVFAVFFRCDAGTVEFPNQSRAKSWIDRYVPTDQAAYATGDSPTCRPA